jgi:hypothetical protein
MGFHEDLRGLDLHAPTNERVENDSGATISKMKVVSLDGMGTTYPKVIPANPNLRSNFGVLTAEMTQGEDELVTALGFMWAVDTSPWPVGTILYSDVNGDLSTATLGAPVAQVIHQDATCGVLYVFALMDLVIDANTNDWNVLGNLGTDPDINFIGTTDNVGWTIRTNDIQRVRIDEQGRTMFGQEVPQGFVHIKEHLSSPGTGRLVHTFEVSTSSTAEQTAFAYTVPDGAVVKIRAHVLGRESNTSRCSFERVNTYTRDGGSAIRVGQGQSSYTYRSHDGYDFKWSQTGDQAILEVKAASANLTKWIGTVEIDVLIA